MTLWTWLRHPGITASTVPMTLDLIRRGEAAMDDLALDRECAIGGAPTMALDRWAPVIHREPRTLLK